MTDWNTPPTPQELARGRTPWGMSPTAREWADTFDADAYLREKAAGAQPLDLEAYLREKMASGKVTDPALLAKLEASDPAPSSKWASAPLVHKWESSPLVTDPELIRKLEEPFDPEKYLREKQIQQMAQHTGRAESFGRGAVQGGTLGFADEGAGSYSAGQKQIERMPELLGVPDADLYALGMANSDDYRQARNQYRDEDKAAERAHPGLYVGCQFAGSMAPALIPGVGAGTRLARLLKAAGAGAALSGAQTVGASESENAGDLARQGVTGAGIGALAGAGAEGLLQGVGAVGRALLPRAQALEQRLAQRLGDKAAKEAEAVARSASGTAGAARANASRTVERLGMPEALAPADIAANQAALSTPEAQRLAQELAAKARAELPEKLAQLQSTEALAAQAATDAAGARAVGQTPEYARQMLIDRAKAQAKRYAIPAAAGAVGYMTGDDEKGGSLLRAGLFAAAGRGVSPGVNAVVRNLLLSPEVRRLAARRGVRAVENLAGMSALPPTLAPIGLADLLARKLNEEGNE